MGKPRTKKPLHVYIDIAILEVVDRWISRQLVAPSRTAVVEQALRSFCEEAKDE